MAWATSKHRGSTRQSRNERALILATWPTCHLQHPGCTGVSTEDDHVIPLSQGGSDDLTNRRGACHNCHAIKTQRESRAGRTRRSPTESRHPGLI